MSLFGETEAHASINVKMTKYHDVHRDIIALVKACLSFSGKTKMFLLIGRFSFPCTSFTSYDLYNEEVRSVQYGFFVLSHAVVGLLHPGNSTINVYTPSWEIIQMVPIGNNTIISDLVNFPMNWLCFFSRENFGIKWTTQISVQLCFRGGDFQRREFVTLPWSWRREDYWSSMA